ncbi:probable serine/threonine-protein kinase mkcF [Panulirus ornatus]|uniref:probable serine/threonine-protein kinase mkcF n=1 Tax=Panulirus ornatus TaxID=150431 RepID=UPI003A83E721
MCHDKVLSREDLDNLVSQGTVLGYGSYGKAYLVRWDNSSAVLKLGNGRATRRDFEVEAYFLDKLDGAGGAPKLLAVSYSPLSLLMSFEGHQTLEDLLRNHHLPSRYLGQIGLQICRCLQEIHARGIIHSDLHSGNILVTVPDDLSLPPKVNIIDFGLATYAVSTIALLPPDDKYLTLTAHVQASFDIDVDDDVGILSETIFVDVFNSMREVPPLYIRQAAMDASVGIQSLEDLMDSVMEIFD